MEQSTCKAASGKIKMVQKKRKKKVNVILKMEISLKLMEFKNYSKVLHTLVFSKAGKQSK